MSMMNEITFDIYVGHITVKREHYNLICEYKRPIVGLVERALKHWLDENERDLRQQIDGES